MTRATFLLMYFFCWQQLQSLAMHQDPLLKVIEAVQNNNTALVEKAVKNGLNVNSKDRSNRSLLLIATQAAHYDMAKLLVSLGADVNMQDDRQESPFLSAGAAGLTGFVQLFLENGARFDVFNRYNGTALIPACERGHVETVALLAGTPGFPLNHINRLGWTALLEAVILGDGSEKYAQVVRILIAAGCDTNITDRQGITALQHARQAGYKTIVKLLEK